VFSGWNLGQFTPQKGFGDFEMRQERWLLMNSPSGFVQILYTSQDVLPTFSSLEHAMHVV
jgi:hypothetical protein